MLMRRAHVVNDIDAPDVAPEQILQAYSVIPTEAYLSHIHIGSILNLCGIREELKLLASSHVASKNAKDVLLHSCTLPERAPPAAVQYLRCPEGFES
eukprot:2385293-Pyramimonas_sp.AAC.1